MESPDIKNAITPISLNSLAKQGARALWKYQCGHSTSTPLNDCSKSSDFYLGQPLNPGHLKCWFLDSGYPSEPDESPIFKHPKVKLASVLSFGRKSSLENDRLSAVGVAATLGRMRIEELTSENSSNSHTEEIKKQMIKIKKRKSISPKFRSSKIYKIKKKVNDAGEHLKKSRISSKLQTSIESTKKHIKSLKSKSPKAFKIGPFRKTVPSVSSSKKLINKQVKNAESPEKCLMKKPSACNVSECPVLKSSRCPRSPKLRTAMRSAIKQQKQEIRKQKEKEIEDFKNMLLEEQTRKEAEEILKLRSDTVFKANPIRKYAPLPKIKRRAVTDPISPNLCKRRRVELSSHISTNSYRTQ